MYSLTVDIDMFLIVAKTCVNNEITYDTEIVNNNMKNMKVTTSSSRSSSAAIAVKNNIVCTSPKAAYSLQIMIKCKQSINNT